MTHTRQKTTRLKHALQHWYFTGDATYRKWASYIVPAESTVYRRHQQFFQVLHRHQSGILAETGRTQVMLPSTAIPIDLTFHHSSIHHYSYQGPYPSLPTPSPSTFQQFVETLPEWEWQLLRHVYLQVDPFTLTDIWKDDHQAQHSILIASDGSAPDFTGSFGWTCKSAGGNSLALNYGPAPGFRTSSYRAEAHGILSAVCFLFRITEFTGNIPLRCRLYCDAKSCLEMVEKMMAWPSYYTNATMLPEWDILQAIVTYRRKLPYLTLHHIKGHQDRAATGPLSLPVRMNIEADSLAAEYQYTSDVNPKQALMVDGNTVLLDTIHGTITAHLKNGLRRLSTRHTIKTHIISRNRWLSLHFDYVDWVSHALAVKKGQHHKHFIIKMIHDWLPIGKLVARYKTCISKECPSCLCCEETRHHFFCCAARQWKSRFYPALTQHLSTNGTSPVLADILQAAIRSVLMDQPVLLPHYPPHYSPLIQRQSAIGWHQLLLGRFVTEWSALHEAYQASSDHQSTHQSGTTWVVATITLIWTHLHHNWEERNQAKHGHDSTTQEQARLLQAQKEITETYELKSKVLPRDRDVFYPSPIHHFEQEPTSTKLRQWLNTWKPTILRSVKECETQGLNAYASIRSFFTHRHYNTNTQSNTPRPQQHTHPQTPPSFSTSIRPLSGNLGVISPQQRNASRIYPSGYITLSPTEPR